MKDSDIRNKLKDWKTLLYTVILYTITVFQVLYTHANIWTATPKTNWAANSMTN